MDQFESGKQAGHARPIAQRHLLGQGLVHAPDHLTMRLGVDIAGRMRDRDEAARHAGVHEPTHDRADFVVRGELQDREQHDRDRLGEIQGVCRADQDLVRVPQVGVEVGAGPFLLAG